MADKGQRGWYISMLPTPHLKHGESITRKNPYDSNSGTRVTSKREALEYLHMLTSDCLFFNNRAANSGLLRYERRSPTELATRDAPAPK